MRRLAWEVYYPDVGDNRKLVQVGDAASAISVELRPPSSGLWRRFMLAIAEHPATKKRMLDLIKEGKSVALAAGMTVKFATLHDELAEIIYMPCVGKFSNLALEDGEVVKDGKQHWSLRNDVDEPDLFQDILDALLERTRLEAGLQRFLDSAPGPPPSAAVQASTPDGTAGSAAPAA